MRKPYWTNRRRRHSDKLICIPNAETKEYGNNLVVRIKSKWSPPPYFYHWQKGGHINAARLHVGRKYYFHVDLRSFYSHVRVARIHRHLKDLFLPNQHKYTPKSKRYRCLREAAYCSTVPLPDNPAVRALPFGFPQSPILASICLQDSILGEFLRELHLSPTYIVTVYMDDIIVSTDSWSCANEAYETLCEKVTRSNFAINTDKCTGVEAGQIKAFNIIVGARDIELTDRRLEKFKETLRSHSISINKRTGILNYVRSINLKQYRELLQTVHYPPRYLRYT